MPRENPILEKSYAFAVRVVQFCRELEERREYVLSRQLLKSGTSVGANIEEAQQPQSRADFLSKMSITLKEAHETRYWLRILKDAHVSSTEAVNPYLHSIEEIIRMLARITYSTRKQSAKT